MIFIASSGFYFLLVHSIRFYILSLTVCALDDDVMMKDENFFPCKKRCQFFCFFEKHQSALTNCTAGSSVTNCLPGVSIFCLIQYMFFSSVYSKRISTYFNFYGFSTEFNMDRAVPNSLAILFFIALHSSAAFKMFNF